MKVLVVNAGSSSLKYQLFDTETEAVLDKGICERIGLEGSLIEHKKADGTKVKNVTPMENHSVATKIVVDMLTDKEHGCLTSMDEIQAVGKYVMLPEVVEALRGNDVFSWQYEKAAMLSRAACPIVNGNTIVGSVYIVEYDMQQGAVMQYQQRSTLTVTIVLEVLLIIFSLIFFCTIL